MGCGAGLLGMIAAKSEKVSGVVFCDKNENAIELAMKNCELNEDELNAKRSFMHTDLFSKIPESEVFDLMIFNTPYLPREDSAKLHSDETAWDGGEKGIEIAERFLKEAVPRLSEGGRILLVSSSFADLSRLLEKASAMGYEKIEEKKKHIFFEDLVSILLQKRQNPL